MQSNLVVPGVLPIYLGRGCGTVGHGRDRYRVAVGGGGKIITANRTGTVALLLFFLLYYAERWRK